MRPTTCLLMLPCLLLVLLASVSARSAAYVDLIDFPRDEANWDRFYELQDRLIANFDEICPDTYCEGDYSNHLALQFRCSVRAVNGTVHACALVVGAGNLDIDPATGAVVAANRTWSCAAPLAPDTPVEAFHAALAGPRPLLAGLPGSGRSIHEALSDCLR